MIIDSGLITGSLTVSGSYLQSGSATIYGDLTVSGTLNATASYALTASYAMNGGGGGGTTTGSFTGSFTGSLYGTASYATYALNAGSGGGGISFPYTGSAIITGSLAVTGSTNISGSINSININTGYPTSNAWQSNLGGSYFNNFTAQTNVSEILRFIAGILSSSAPDASPNTRTFGSYTANPVNATTGTVTAGSVPSGSTNQTIIYLNSRGFANSGSAIFSGLTVYSSSNYYYNYTSVASGSTTISSSNDAQLFGLGPLNNGAPTSFSVSGSFTFKFKDNSTKTDTATSSSQALITQTGAGTTAGVTLAKINTANPAVIPSAYQDGKFATVFTASLYSGSAQAVSSSGYYHVSASILIASGSSTYTVPSASNVEIFWAPITTISASIAANTLTINGATAALTATSRSLSGAPYLSGSTYNISGSITGSFNPLYFAGAGIGSITVSGTGVTNTSGVITVSTLGGTVQTANAIYDSTGVTARATGVVPAESDAIKLNGLYTFVAATSTNISQIGTGSSTFTLTLNAVNKNSTTSTSVNTLSYHTVGNFGQPATSGGLAYWGPGQGTDTATNGGASNSEPFLGENYRIQLNDTVLAFSGSAWNTAFNLYNLSGSDLQIKPGYLVKPGGTYKYWLNDPDATKTYKYYIRKFTTNAAAKTSMTLNVGQVLTDWQTSGSNTIGALVLFESSNSNIYTPARFYDPTKTTSNFVTNLTANTDGQNPFGSQIGLYGNTGGSLATTTYTIPLRSADGMSLNSTYTNVYVIMKYNGDPTPITNITVTFA